MTRDQSVRRVDEPNAQFCRVSITTKALRENVQLDLNDREARLFILAIEDAVKKMAIESMYDEIHRLARLAGIKIMS